MTFTSRHRLDTQKILGVEGKIASKVMTMLLLLLLQQVVVLTRVASSPQQQELLASVAPLVMPADWGQDFQGCQESGGLLRAAVCLLRVSCDGYLFSCSASKWVFGLRLGCFANVSLSIISCHACAHPCGLIKLADLNCACRCGPGLLRHKQNGWAWKICLHFTLCWSAFVWRLWDYFIWLPHFINEETEAQKWSRFFHLIALLLE